MASGTFSESGVLFESKIAGKSSEVEMSAKMSDPKMLLQ